MEKKIKIIVVDDNEPFLEGIQTLLRNDTKYDVVATATNGAELLENTSLCQADVLLLDIEMPIMNGFEIAKHVNWECPQKKIIAVTMYKDKVYLEQLIGAGFKGFVCKTDIAEELFNTIDLVVDNRFIFPDELKTRI